MIVSLYTVRVVLRVLGVEDYGVFVSIGGVITTLSVISKVLANSSQRFFAYELGRGDESNYEVVFNTVLVVYLLVSILMVVFVETLGYWFVFHKMNIPTNSVTDAKWVFHFALATFIVSVITNPFQAAIIAHEKMEVYAYISIFEVILKLIVVFILQYADVSKLMLYAILLFLLGLVVNSLYIIFSFYQTHRVRLSFKLCNKDTLKTVFSYSSWTLFGTMAGVANYQGIIILLNMFWGPAINAAYAIGHQVSNTVYSFSINFYTAVKPPLIKSYAQNDTEYMMKLFYFSSKVIFVLLFVLLTPIFLMTDTILNLWLGKVELYMVEFTQLLLIYILILAMSMPITTIVQAANYVKLYHGITDGFTLLSLPLSYLALKLVDLPYSPVIVSIVVFLIAHFLRLIVLRRVVEFSYYYYFKTIVFPILISVLIVALPLFYFKDYFELSNLTSFFFVTIISILYTSAVVGWLLFDKDEKKLMIQLVKRKLYKK